MMKTLLVILVGILFLTCMQQVTPAYQATVSEGFSGEPGAVIGDTPVYSSIGEALAAIPAARDKPFRIFIQNGYYYEKLRVDKPDVHFIGENRDETIITFDATGDTPDPAGGTYGTRGCFTLGITAPGFMAENLTIENSFDYPANLARAEDDPAKVHNPQAVALMTFDKSDRAVFKNCNIRGYQDTLFPNAGRHYFYNCQISGHVDFIFGAGQAVFENCEIVSRNRIGKNPTGYITAPSTPAMYPYGFLFLKSRLVKENPDMPAGSVRLGRPWHPGADSTVSGSAVFVQCYMDDHIGEIGYARISSRDSSGNRIWFDLAPDSRFFEHASYGPGAIYSSKRPVLSEMAAEWYTSDHVLGDWSPYNK